MNLEEKKDNQLLFIFSLRVRLPFFIFEFDFVLPTHLYMYIISYCVSLVLSSHCLEVIVIQTNAL